MQNLNPIVTAAMANKNEANSKLGPMRNSPTVGEMLSEVCCAG